MNYPKNAVSAFEQLVETIQKLRDPESGCPWDLEQTHGTLKQYVVEEAYELIEAIDNEPKKIPEELGDLLLQVMLHSQIAADQNTFSITEVIETLNHKLIERHPHVFGDTECSDSAAVTRAWEKSKKNGSKGLLEGVPKSLPALHKAQLIGERTARVGFDWSDAESVIPKVKEELDEYLETVKEKQEVDRQTEELGDLFFSLVQLARKQGLQAEEVLQKACTKFIDRFSAMEHLASEELGDLSKEELEKLWKKIKAK